MKIFNMLIETAPIKVFVSLLFGTVAGVGYAFLIPIIIESFGAGGGIEQVKETPAIFLGLEVSNYKFAALFGGACLVILAGRTLSQLTLSRVAIDTTSRLRIEYYDAIVKSPLSKLEQVGSSRLIASFTTDIKAIIGGAMLLPDLLISGVTLVGMMIFLLYLNVDIFLFICGATLFGVVTYILPMVFAGKLFKSAREKVDALQEGIKGNIYGVKELKLSASRRESYFADVLLKTEKEVRVVNKRAITIVRTATNYGDMISFFVMGYVAFIFLNYHSVSQGELLAAVMILLYITGPVSIIMNALPEIINANISLVKVQGLFSDIPVEDIDIEVKPLPAWQRLNFSKVVYRYPPKEGEQESTFSVGPIDLEINRGEITFIVGGNGSGKSTLSKLITSYYQHESGEIYLDDHLLDKSWVNSFRDQVSAVYTDYYLFDQLLGDIKALDKSLVDNYLERLQLTEKVSIEDGRFSTLSLSDGQRKRLALLVSLLEDKQLYLFDEWAADQDPEFKQVFYYDILPYLKSKGKAVVAISHDDRYFDIADRVLTMENGRCGAIDLNSDQQGYNHIETKVPDVHAGEKVQPDGSTKENI